MQTAKWRIENIDRARELERQSALRRQPKRSAYQKEWAKRNPEYTKLNDKVQAAKRRASGYISKSDIISILARQKWLCAEPTCTKSLKQGYHLDHVMPIALGGLTSKQNCQCLCQNCNQTKSKKHPVDFARQKGRLL